MRTSIVCLLMSLTFYSKHALCQHEADNWRFGKYCSINFASGLPVNIINNAMNAIEGCSSISDTMGNLLFYTNGFQVWNKDDQVMPNGDSLLGNTGAAQSSIILKKIGVNGMYYLFTTDASEHYNGINGLCYSVIDMSLNGGLGDVTIKNILVLTPTDEKLSAIFCNAINGYWVIVHQQPNKYCSIPITANGVGSPVISSVGSLNTYVYPEQGMIKISPVCNKIVTTLNTISKLEFCDFDPNTGIVSGCFSFTDTTHNFYGIEFSKTGNFLYAGTDFSQPPFKIYQFDMTQSDSTSITSSAQITFNGSSKVDGMQMAPDGKIYVAHYNKYFLGCINSPDSLGLACNYVDTAFMLNAQCKYGLPNSVVIPFYQNPHASIQPTVTKICPDSCISFGNQSTNASSYEWFFAGATPNYSTDPFPTNICYSTSGNYDVTLIAHNGPYSDTTVSSSLIQVYASPGPTIVQSNDTLYATDVQAGSTYQWSLNANVIIGSTNAFCIPIVNGTYSVIVTNQNGCNGSDALVVTTIGISEVNESTFQLFPNPADESVTVSLSNHQPAEIKLYNTLGQLIQNATFDKLSTGLVLNEVTLDLSNVLSGVYYISIQTENNIETRRLIVTH